MRRSLRTVAHIGAAALGLFSAVCGARADTMTYAPGNFPALTATLSALGMSGAAANALETFSVPGTTGTSTRLDFGFIQDLGGYQFSFGVFDVGAVTADPLHERGGWGIQALSSATLIFDNRGLAPGATASIDVAAGTQLGLFLIPDDTLAQVMSDPGAFYRSSRPAPLFSVAAANPGGYDQLLAFESAGLYTFAFEDLTRTGWSDLDFNDLVVTMRATPAAFKAQIDSVPEPAGLWLFLAAGLPIFLMRRGRKA